MKAMVVTRIGAIEQQDRPDPVPGPGEVLVTVSVTGVCRTDVKLIRVGHRDLVLPRVPGEETVGVIAAVGPGVPAPWTLGQRAYIYPGAWCGQCRPCRRGAENLCESMRIMGFHRDGGFAECLLAPVQSLIPLPEGLPDDVAVFAEPLSCCLNALELADVGRGDTLAVWGAGPAGTLLCRAARCLGAAVTALDPDPARRERSGGVASLPDGESFDRCVVAVGSESAYQEALAHLGPRGRLVVFSGLAPAARRQAVDLNALHYHEQSLVGAYGCAFRHGVKALQWLADGRVRVDDLVTHRLSLWDLDAALDGVEKRVGLKVLLYPGPVTGGVEKRKCEGGRSRGSSTLQNGNEQSGCGTS